MRHDRQYTSVRLRTLMKAQLVESIGRELYRITERVRVYIPGVKYLRYQSVVKEREFEYEN